MTTTKISEIDALNKIASNFSDGAYLQFMEDHGVSMKELEDYCNQQNKGGHNERKRNSKHPNR